MMVEALFDCYLEDLSRSDANQSIFTDYISRFPDDYLSSTADERIVADKIRCKFRKIKILLIAKKIAN